MLVLPQSVFALRDYSKSIKIELHCFYLHLSFCRKLKNMVVRLKFQRSEFVHRFVTDMVSGFSTSAFLFHLFKDRKKTLVLQGFSGCIVNVCYTPRESPTKDAMEVVVLLWGFFVF